MRLYYIGQKLKSFGAFLVILVFLPYITAVFVNGAGVRNEESQPYVTVRTGQGGQEETGEVEWTEYLAGILAREMSEEYEDEALKAQAVLIRTGLYRTLSDSEDKILTEEYMTRSEMEKKWGGSFEQNYKKYTGAVRETDDAVLFYGETYAWTPFHQSSCGMTRSAEEVVGTEEYPYLRAKECPLDKEADDEIQVFTYHYAEIQELCRDFLVAEDEKEQAEGGYAFDDFEIQSRDSAGYVKSLRIGNTVCTGDQFRDALSLPSSAFSFSESGEEMKITTTGIGHGLGMSQWTANEMAKEGSSWEEILQFFFEGTTVNREIQETELLSGTEEKYLTYSPI